MCLMGIDEKQTILRFRQFFRKDDMPKNYRHSYEAVDDHTKQVLSTCDLFGQAIFSTLAVSDDHQQTWQMTPNRKIMPSRWMITDSEQNIIMQFDQKILGKLMNPIYKVMLSLQDHQGTEVYRLVDPRTNIPDRVMSIVPSDWALLKNDKPVAKIVRLRRPMKKPKGFIGKLRGFFPVLDHCLVSAGEDHILAAPVALCMIMIFSELKEKMTSA